MKHSLPITLLLVGLFLAAQIIGVSLIFLDQDIVVEDGVRTVEYGMTALGERPALEGQASLWFLLAGVALGTILLLFLVRIKAFGLWKAWFFLAVWLALTVAFGVIIPNPAAYVLGLILASWKVFRPGPIIHNLTEIFIYAGIAVLLVPLFDLFWAIMLLLAISVYDIIAVWWSKHMVTLAEAQTKSNLFAGLYLPTKKEISAHGKAVPSPQGKKRKGGAILGGGDIAFPLLFSGAALAWLVERGASPLAALYQSLIIVAFATLSLALLFTFAKKERFYPAMPFLTAGCLAGLGVVRILLSVMGI